MRTESEIWYMIWQYFKMSERPTIQRIAANVVSRYIWEIHHYGMQDMKTLRRLEKRFKLSEYVFACFEVFPPKSSY